MGLTSAAACEDYMRTQSNETIATRLRYDQRLCREGRLPSVLAFCLPPASSEKADEIATFLTPAVDRTSNLRDVRRLVYSAICQGIKGYLAQMEHQIESPLNGESGKSTSRSIDEASAIASCIREITNGAPDDPEKSPKVEPSSEVHTSTTNPSEPSTKKASYITSSDLQGALKVLHHLQGNSAISTDTTLPDIISYMKTLFPQATRTSSHPSRPLLRKCYICRFVMKESHALYSALCKQCGDFNLAEVGLSLPERLDLRGKTAVVTGGRVNLGFHTALRLLRCGASVIVSSRYPRDAELRFLNEADSGRWKDRLRLVGADFRRAKDVFRFVGTIKAILTDWCSLRDTNLEGRLDILINNAAQTLTDPIAAEKKAIQNEIKLQRLLDNTSCVVDNGYEATVRGGAPRFGGLLECQDTIGDEMSDKHTTYSSQETESEREAIVASAYIPSEDIDSLVQRPMKSSWVQRLGEIPYEDFISAHSVNTLVPLILIRELLPLMGHPVTVDPVSNPKKPAHIINVSSREGIFESSPRSAEKSGHHVHTNMSKAGLNMITDTEAAVAWSSRRVAMNTVDPGYMSAAPEMRSQGECPIGFEDGAGRVLWPIAVAERGDEPVWGRFLKHFGRVEVDACLGR